MFDAAFLAKIAGQLMGVQPDELRQQFMMLQQWNINAIKAFDDRLTRLEINQAEALRHLSALSQHFGAMENGRTESNGFAIDHADDAGRDSANGAANQFDA